MPEKRDRSAEILKDFQKKAASAFEANRKFFRRLGKMNERELDAAFHKAHEEVFSCMDCMQCANCCKTISPIITQKDMERLSKSLKISVSDFIKTYIRMDEDGDFVFKQTPCPFLASDNSCTVYNDRPKACREYPHTDRRRMKQILDITLENTRSCPAVWEMVERMKNK